MAITYDNLNLAGIRKGRQFQSPDPQSKVYGKTEDGKFNKAMATKVFHSIRNDLIREAAGRWYSGKKPGQLPHQ